MSHETQAEAEAPAIDELSSRPKVFDPNEPKVDRYQRVDAMDGLAAINDELYHSIDSIEMKQVKLQNDTADAVVTKLDASKAQSDANPIDNSVFILFEK